MDKKKVLKVLFESQKMYFQEIFDAVGGNRNSIKRLLDEFIEAGLVEKEKETKRGEKCFYWLTKKGRKTHLRITLDTINETVKEIKEISNKAIEDIKEISEVILSDPEKCEEWKLWTKNAIEVLIQVLELRFLRFADHVQIEDRWSVEKLKDATSSGTFNFVVNLKSASTVSG